MKKIFFYLLLLVSFSALQAQQPQKKVKPAPQKSEQEEVNDMLKEAQQELDKMSPEEKAEMEKMGIKMPKDLTKIIPQGVTIEGVEKMEKEMAAQYQEWRKEAIAALPKKVLTDAEMRVYLQSYFENVERKISPKGKANALKIYDDCKAKGLKNLDIENTAIALWIKRAKQEAVWILAKTAIQEPQNSNLLNNVAATTTMLGGGHLALPLLQKINQKIPNHAAILNNMGQAWCDLGAIDSTKKYLMLALNADPLNSTANYTMSCIYIAEGKTAEAIDYLKRSIKNGFSSKKAAIAQKLGSPLTRKDISGFPPDEDPMRMERTTLPNYAFEVNASGMARSNWKAFQTTAKIKAQEYKAVAEKLAPIVERKWQALQMEAIQTKNPRLLVPPLAEKAAIYYGQKFEEILKSDSYYGRRFEGIFNSLYKNQAAKLEAAIKSLREIRDRQSDKLHTELTQKYPRCPGEGCDFTAWCNDKMNGENDYNNSYLNGANALYEKFNLECVELMSKSANAGASMSLYVFNFPEQIEYTNLMIKAGFLEKLSELSHEEIDPSNPTGVCLPKRPPSIAAPFKLLDYDDVTCKTTSQIAIGIAKFKLDCSKMSFEGGEGLLGSFEGNFKTGEFDIGIGIGVEEHLAGGGVAKLEAGVKEMAIFHFDQDGYLTDYGYKFSAGIEGKLGPVTAEWEGSMSHTVQSGVTFDNEVTTGFKLFGKK